MTLTIKSRKRAPKTYRKPKGLSLDATGLLTHMRENLSSDGNYRWGVKCSAEFFGVGRNRIADAYDELERADIITRMDVPKDATQKQPPRVVKLNPCSRISTGQVPVNNEQSEIQGEKRAVLTGKHQTVSMDNTHKPIDIAHSQITVNSPITPTVLVLTDKHGFPADELTQLDAEIAEAEAKVNACTGWGKEVSALQDHLKRHALAATESAEGEGGEAMSRYEWATPRTQGERVRIPPEDRRVAEAWLEQYGDRLPSMSDGDDKYVRTHTWHRLDVEDREHETGEDARHDLADLAEVDEEDTAPSVLTAKVNQAIDKVADTPHTKSEYAGDLSSGSLASSWVSVERVLISYYGKPAFSPSTFLRLERSQAKPKRHQVRGNRTDYSVRKVWDSVTQELTDEHIDRFYTIRWRTKMAFDADANEFREIKAYEPFDEQAIEHERRVMSKKSTKRVEIAGSPDPVPTTIRFSLPPSVEREWDGDESDPAYQAWLGPRV